MKKILILNAKQEPAYQSDPWSGCIGLRFATSEGYDLEALRRQ